MTRKSPKLFPIRIYARFSMLVFPLGPLASLVFLFLLFHPCLLATMDGSSPPPFVLLIVFIRARLFVNQIKVLGIPKDCASLWKIRTLAFCGSKTRYVLCVGGCVCSPPSLGGRSVISPLTTLSLTIDPSATPFGLGAYYLLTPTFILSTFHTSTAP